MGRGQELTAALVSDLAVGRSGRGGTSCVLMFLFTSYIANACMLASLVS